MAGVEPFEDFQPRGNMYVAIFTVMLGAMMFGFDQGNFGNIQGAPGFLNDWCLHKFGDAISCGHGSASNEAWNNFIGWASSIIPMSSAAGALLLGPMLTNNFGRRLCISVGSFVCFVGTLMTSYMAFGSKTVFLMGRFVTGFGVGTCTFALPLYNSEIATPSVRGMTGTLMELNTMLGVFLATVITTFDPDWRRGMLLPGMIGAIVAVVVWFTPESPRYLMNTQGVDACLASLRRVRLGDVEAEARGIAAQLDVERQTGQVTYRDLLKPGLRKRVFVACGLNIGQQVTGMNVFMNFAFTFFNKAGVHNEFTANTILTGVELAGVVVGLWLMDSKYGGRRPLLLVATVLVGVPLFFLAPAITQKWSGMATVSLICVYGFGNELAWGPIPWTYPSEIFTMAEKDKAASVAIFMQYIFNFVVVYFGQKLLTWSPAGMCLVFGVINVFNFVFVSLFVKETKGLPLEMIPALFAGKNNLAVLEV